MYKVYFNDRVICLNSKIENSVDTDTINVDNFTELKSLLVTFIEGEEDLILSSDNPEKLLDWLKEDLNYLEAAGGIVKNEEDELLFIYRLEFWDLPKGKIEANESPEVAAYREIKEECGITTHRLEKEICSTYHIYELKGEMILKKTFWFSFVLEDNSEDVTPQTEENIELVSWFGEDEIQLALLDSYQSIKEVYSVYKQKELAD